MLRIAEFSLLAVRLILAFVFLLAGAAKLVDPVGLRRTWREFGLPNFLARPAVLLLPLAELAVALTLIPPRVAWYGACGALALLTGFLLVVGVAMVRGRKPDCRCFGQLRSKPVGRATLIRDGMMAAGAGWLVWQGRLQPGPDLWAWFLTLDTQGRKVAVVVACVAGFLFFRLLDRARPRTEPVEPEIAIEAEEEERPRPRQRPRPAPAKRYAPPEPPDAAPSRATGVGLPVGTPAPEFELPAMGGGRRSLRALREPGKDVLLVFSSPFCESCHALVPHLARWSREMDGWLNVVVISRGSVPDNLSKLKGLETSRVLLQREFEISEAFDCTSTPTAILVGADGLIRSEPAVGREAIQQLISTSAQSASDRVS